MKQIMIQQEYGARQGVATPNIYADLNFIGDICRRYHFEAHKRLDVNQLLFTTHIWLRILN